MKARPFLWLGIGLLFAGFPLAAHQPPTPARGTIDERIEKLLRQLDAPRFARRDRAMRELRELGDKAVTPLTKALAAPHSAEFQRRAHILLERFRPVVAKPLTLQDRCQKLWILQVGVSYGTKALARRIACNADRKPSRANRQDAQALADEQKQIVNEATRAVEILKAEGSGVAFEEVFSVMRDDMKGVQKRLEVLDVGKGNLGLQHDIIDTLWEMIVALKKARKGIHCLLE
jgi:hypothetical protein